MRGKDVEAVGDLAGGALALGGRLIEDVHTGVASRPFGILGLWAAPVRVVHDGVSRAVYGGVRRGLSAAARGGGKLAAGAASERGPALESHPAGALAVAALNGLYGNHLVTRGNHLALGMEVRRDGAPVPVTDEALADAFPDATSRLAVFAHGLGETDEAWRLLPRRARRAGERTYGERLQDELSFTPVHLRYNTGLHVSDNGRALAELLEQLVGAWPVGVEEIVLIGHSMGGLVVRSACHRAECDGLRWTDAVRHVFCLGSPHLGADLEKGVHALARALHRLPETRAVANALRTRSDGIKDLRFGSCAEEDWRDCDPETFLSDRCAEVPFLPDANYYFVGASLSEGPLGTMLGDLLVRLPSSSGRGNGRGRRIPFPVDNGLELHGLTHFDLLNHPQVYERLRDWIVREPVTAAPV